MAYLETKSFGEIFNLTRPTSKWVFNQQGQLVEVPAGQPAFSYDPVTGESKGILIEETRTNLLRWSEDLTRAAWDVSGSANTASTAKKLIEAEDSVATTHVARQSIGKAESPLTYTYTVVTDGGERNLRLDISDSGTTNRALWLVNPNTGEGIGSIQTTGTFTNATGNVVPLGGGKLAFSLTATTGPEPSVRSQLVLANGTQLSYIGDGESGVNILRQQLEEGSSPSSYIPTENTAVTRLADRVTVPDLSGWFNAGEGTFVVEFTYSSNAYSPFMLSNFTSPTTIERLALVSTTGTDIRFHFRSGGTNLDLIAGTGMVKGQRYRVAYKWNSTTFAASMNGAAVVSASTGGIIPAVGVAVVGAASSETNHLNGTITQVRYVPYAVSDAELQELSTL